MAATAIADLWTPDIWIRGVNEKANVLPSIINSGIAVKTEEFNAIASGAGVTVNVPFFKDISDQADEIQVPSTKPTVNNNGAGVQVAPMLNRVSANGVEALAAQVSGSDPVGFITGQLGLIRLKQRQATLIAILRGLFGDALADNELDISGETDPDDTLINGVRAISTMALLGELQNDLLNGAMFAHPDIRAALLAQDEKQFFRSAEGPFTIERYKGVPLFVSSLLKSGSNYETYFAANGVLAIGEKPQQGDVIDVASLQFYADKQINNQEIYDRTRCLLHVAGTKWVGTAAGQSATNAELADEDSWELVYQTANRVPVVRLVSKG